MITNFNLDINNQNNISKSLINKKGVSLIYNIIISIFFDIVTKHKDKVLESDDAVVTINSLLEEYVEHYILNYVGKDVADVIVDKISDEEITLYYYLDKETNLIVYLSYKSFEIIENETAVKLYDLFISDINKANLTLRDIPYFKINTSIINKMLKSKYVI